MRKPHILIVDDDQSFANLLKDALEGLFKVETCHSERAFYEHFAIGRYDLIIMDMRLREQQEGLELLKEVQIQDPTQAAIVMTAYADQNSYANAIESGALTYLDKREFSPTLIARTVEALAQQGILRKRVAALENRLDRTEPLEIIGASAAIRDVRMALQRAAGDGTLPVLIYGELGSGRELVARNIHRLGRLRDEGPFVTGSYTPYQESMTVNELFGTSRHLKNGSWLHSRGWMDEAKGGVLYVNNAHRLDEAAIQGLLGYLETGYFDRVGGDDRIDADVQLILSTTHDRAGNSAFGRLRNVLLERHGGVLIEVRPLRERREDIPLLAQYTLQNLYRRGRTRTRSIRGSAIGLLERFFWPGNVRELMGAVEYAAIRADAMEGGEIGPEHLPQSVLPSSTGDDTTMVSMLNYRLHLARAELGLVESTISTFETTKQADLAAKLHYNDRFTFARRIRRCLESYPTLDREFPRTHALFFGKRRADSGKQEAQADAS